MKKFLMLTIRGSFRSVRNHPFAVVVLCFLIFMYRSYPFMFTLLVSASPILICTAVLLGTLLSFGQRNIPELEIEEKTTSLKTGLSTDAIVVEQNDKYYVDRYIEKRRDETNDSTNTNLGESCGKSNSNDTSPLIGESKLENGEILRELDDETIDTKKNKWMNEENVETDDEKSVADSFDSERVNVDCLDSPPHSPWKNIEDDHEEEEEEEEEEEVEEEVEEDDEEEDTLDSGSDRAESSSPDASMADIMPMLDELHPLLDEEAAQNVQTSRDNSDAASEHSTESTTTATTTTNESCDEIETHDELEEVAEDDDDDEDDDEAKEDDKEEQTKSAITWTEEDQKNLMDLGSSEIERNQRLENLILRRRTRKYTSMVPEINLIDLESSDIPFNVAPISTSRQNPFDLPHDSCDNSGLPPIPGSAPSVLLPRRNPFDIPFDYATEEKPPNLTGDGFSREELTALHLREPFFRRHESFNVGPSIFAPNNRGDVKLRPYFVPERMVSEESSYFHRQSSEMSDSKVSSVPETESVGSVEDLEYQNLPEEDNTPSELEAISKMEEVTEECPSEEDCVVASKREFSEEEEEEDVHCELELISEMEHVSEHIGHGSQSSSSSEDFLEVGRVETRDVEEHYVEESVESTDPSVDNPLVDEVPHKEPVYDSSPTSRKNISSSSSSSDMHVPHVLVKRTVSFTERESENRGVDENGSLCVDDTNVREHDNIKGDSTVDVSIPSKPSVEASVEENFKDKNTQGQAPSSSSGLDIHAMADDDKKMGKSEKEKCLLIKGDDSIDKGETVVSPNSDADYEEANEKLISTPSAGGSTPLFYDIRMHDNDYEHHDEVQVPNTPVESFENVRAIQNLNISEVHDLDHGISRKINSPFTPDFVSMPSSSTSSEESTSRVDMETILEEDDEIKEMDGILSELDSVGDFSTTQWGSSSNESDEKHVIDSVGENSSSANRVEETSTDKVNKTEHGHSTGEEIDIHEEDIESISELHTSEASTTAEKNSTANSALNHVYEDGISQKPELETQSTQGAGSLPKKADLATLETDDQVHALMKQSSEIEKPVVVKPPEAEVAIRESAAQHSESEAMQLHTNVVGLDQETPVLEVSSIDNAGENTAEAVPSEGASLRPSKKLEDDNSEKEVKPKMDDGSVQVEADKVVGSSSVGPDESSVKEGSSVGTEKLENEVKAKSVKGKGKSSKKSKSGSSSSSSSSSSDSD